jgi:1-acyl-sn-glycerol-3-phosphate acyltransferase
LTVSEVAWALGRFYMGLPTRAVTRPRVYGLDRIPRTGGAVYAMNHMHWLDVPLIGVVSPRNMDFVAKAEAVDLPGVGRFLRWHGTIAVRRGESDRDAVRRMRESARAGRVVGLFVEGTRNDSGRPGPAQPGAAMVAIQEDVPVIPVAIYGTQFWKVGDWSRCSVAFGEPLRFEGLPKGGKGYKQATIEIERRINVLFDWLAELHAQGRDAQGGAGSATPPV